MFITRWISQLFAAQEAPSPAASACEAVLDAYCRKLLRANNRQANYWTGSDAGTSTNSRQFYWTDPDAKVSTNGQQNNDWTGPDAVLIAYSRQVDGCTAPEARALLAALVAAHGGEPLDEWRRRVVR